METVIKVRRVPLCGYINPYSIKYKTQIREIYEIINPNSFSGSNTESRAFLSVRHNSTIFNINILHLPDILSKKNV